MRARGRDHAGHTDQPHHDPVFFRQLAGRESGLCSGGQGARRRPDAAAVIRDAAQSPWRHDLGVRPRFGTRPGRHAHRVDAGRKRHRVHPKASWTRPEPLPPISHWSRPPTTTAWNFDPFLPAESPFIYLQPSRSFPYGFWVEKERKCYDPGCCSKKQSLWFFPGPWRLSSVRLYCFLWDTFCAKDLQSLGSESYLWTGGPLDRRYWATHGFLTEFLQLSWARCTLVISATVLAVPVGVCSGIYLAEYARPATNKLFGFFFDILAGIPSIVIGLFGFSIAIFLHKQFSDRLGLCLAHQCDLTRLSCTSLHYSKHPSILGKFTGPHPQNRACL